jgi:adenylate cyclase
MALARFSPGLRHWLTVLLLAAVVAVLLLVFTQEAILQLGLLQRLELATLDYRFQTRGPRLFPAGSSNVVIVQISEDSFKALPDKFPWPRSYYAHLVRNLRRAGARAVGIDLIFNDRDSYSQANDDSLRAAIRQSEIVVLAGKGELERANVRIVSAEENFNNIFFTVDSSLGYVDIRADVDGIYRFYNTYWVKELMGGREARIPSFGFAVLNRFFHYPPLTVPTRRQDDFVYAGRTVPKYDPGSFLVNYYGPNNTFPYINIEDVLDDETFQTVDEIETGEQINTFSDPGGYLYNGTFTNKIVLVGITIPEYKDLFPVSIARGLQRGDNQMYGVEIHANAIENILRNDFLRRESPPLEIASVWFFSMVTVLVISRLKESKTKKTVFIEIQCACFAAAEIAFVGVAGVVLFNTQNYVLTVVSPSLAVIGGYFATTAYHFISERRQRLLIKSMFSTYVNPSVVDQLIANPERLRLGGQREELTVLFSDIEGFTSISEELESEVLVALLNDYLSKMAKVILRNTGTLDKYVGDAIVAFWGAPIPQQDHALRACMAALQMQEVLAAMNNLWAQQQKPIFRTRIGINTGEMVVGNMGGAEKVNYTVIGDSVNLASRLEGANKQYGTGIMVSQRTYELVKQKILGRNLDRIVVKGRSEPVTICELIQLRDRPVAGDLEKFLQLYAGAHVLYLQRQWAAAIKKLEEALAIRPNDRPTKLYIERARLYQTQPPPKKWDGVFIMKTK